LVRYIIDLYKETYNFKEIRRTIVSSWLAKLSSLQKEVCNFVITFLIQQVQAFVQISATTMEELYITMATVLNIGEDLIERVVRHWWNLEGLNFCLCN
jgi:hypothetical protein